MRLLAEMFFGFAALIGGLLGLNQAPEGGVAGPVAIARITGEVFKTGWREYFNLTAVLSLVGIVILPVIRYSVYWNSLHQKPSVTRLGAPTVDPSLLWPLLVMGLAMIVLFATLHLKAMRNEILRRRAKALRLIEVQRAGGAFAGQPAE